MALPQAHMSSCTNSSSHLPGYSPGYLSLSFILDSRESPREQRMLSEARVPCDVFPTGLRAHGEMESYGELG